MLGFITPGSCFGNQKGHLMIFLSNCQTISGVEARMLI